MSNNNATVSISIKANVNMSEQMKEKIKELYPHIYNEYSNDDEGLAMVALFAAMERYVPKNCEWGDLISNIELV